MLERLRGLAGPGRRLLAVSPCRAAVHTVQYVQYRSTTWVRVDIMAVYYVDLLQPGGKSDWKDGHGMDLRAVLIIDHGLAASSSVP
eukprot:COSAG06_NODE_130_length_22547_cov_24.796418_11_plen_86_part_00